MEIVVRTGATLGETTELAIVATFQGEDLPAGLGELIPAADFSAKPNETALVYPRGAVAPTRVLLVGLGARAAAGAEQLRQALATGIRQARTLQVADVIVGLPAELPAEAGAAGQACAEGLILGAYRFIAHRTGLPAEETFVVQSVAILVEGDPAGLAGGAAVGTAIAEAVCFARDLVNTPGGMKTPPQLADEAVALGARSGLSVTVFDEQRLEEEGFGGILAVGQGSDSPPRFIVVEHGADKAGAPTICLVGKGLTFDSGGLNIKPAEGMETMKNDMGGSAAVFGTMMAVAVLDLPLHVVGLVPSAENMPSGRAYRPGDIVTSLSGKTIEILNTDAEGRVILSDGLHYAQRYEPEAIIELSTLTGAIIIALGSLATGLMATDDDLADALVDAGQAAGDRAWQLPLWQEYRDMVKSEVADLKNLAGRPAGSITAGAFLAAFAGDVPFAHLDIAGTAWLDGPSKPYQSKGGTGAGVGLLVEYLRRRAAA